MMARDSAGHHRNYLWHIPRTSLEDVISGPLSEKQGLVQTCAWKGPIAMYL